MRWRYAKAQATVLLCDGFAVLDRERLYVDYKLAANGIDWVDVSDDASANVTRFRLSRASPPTAGTLRLVFAIGSTPGSTTTRSAASTARGASRSLWLARVTQLSGASCLAVSNRLRAAVCARPSNSACCRASGVYGPRGLCRSWLHTVRSFSTPRSLFDCLEKRYAELDQLCNLMSNSAADARAAALRARVGVAGV
jgi:hypothetical protein